MEDRKQTPKQNKETQLTEKGRTKQDRFKTCFMTATNYLVCQLPYNKMEK